MYILITFLSEEDDCPRPELPDPVLVSVRLGRDLVVRQLAAQFVSPLTRLKFAFVSYLRHNNTSNSNKQPLLVTVLSLF